MKKIYIYDFGSQYTQLIARRFRELGYYAEILPFNFEPPEDAVAFVLSGGPASVYEDRAPLPPLSVLKSSKPILGICYGLQVIAHLLGGKVAPSQRKEYGPANLEVLNEDHLFKGLPRTFRVWMSHGDKVEEISEGFEVLAKTEGSPYAAIFNEKLRIFGVQFHPEVAHTEFGERILRNFAEYSGIERNWTTENIYEEIVREIRERVKDEGVILALSGGVDSTVLGKILERSLPREQLNFVFVDTGLLRYGEVERIKKLFPYAHILNERERFLSRLKGVKDPEEKRKIIGGTFIEVFESFAEGLEKTV
jgi:GMP synthase (glutamine-hydrolysing)